MGLFKSKKKANETSNLVCQPGDSESYKCIFLASYRDLPVDIEWNVSSLDDEKLSESLHMDNLTQFPCLKDGDFIVTGMRGVLTYLNIKGRTPTIHPRKARVLAMQQYWIQVLTKKFEPLLNNISNRKKEIKKVLEVFDKNIKDKDYIVGEFSLADIHWSGVFKMLEESGQSEVFSSYENINNWLTRVKADIPGYESKVEKVAA